MPEEPVEMLNLPVRDIKFGERMREKYEGLDTLALDMKSKGVIQPIAVQRLEDGTYLLLAGGRRFSAALLGKIETLPCRVYPPGLDELDRREIELMENVSRKELTWPEQVRLTEEIHRLNVERNGAAAGPSEGHSAADTARLLGVSPMSVSRDRQLVDGIRKYGSELLVAKNKSQALTRLEMLERKEEAHKAVAAVEEKMKYGGIDELRTALINGYFVGDFLEGVKRVPDKVANLVEIDPPYGIALDEIKDGRDNAIMDDYTDVPSEQYEWFLRQVAAETWRLLMASGWVLHWCAAQNVTLVREILEDVGFKVAPIPLIWVKPNIPGQTNQPSMYLGNIYETCVYARKGEAAIYRRGRTNVYTYNVVAHADKIHSTERPVELMKDILDTFLVPGGQIVVPFLGSGNTLLAASNHSCRGFGWDLSPDYRALYVARVQAGEPGKFKSYRTP